MLIKIVLCIVLFSWLDALGCYDISKDQSTHMKRSIQPISSNNVSRSLTLDQYNNYRTSASSKVYRTNELQPEFNTANRRAMRKINLLGNLFQKRQPLYLVNGTVCRFVNTVPICTTLSTSGVLPPSGGGGAPRPVTAPSTSGNNSQGQNISFNGQTQGTTPINFNPNNLVQNPNNNFAPRPAALVEDDSEDINVNTLTNNQLTASNGQNQIYQLDQGHMQQLQQVAQQNLSIPNPNNNLQLQQSTAVPLVQSDNRPFGYLMQRRPQFPLRRNQYRPA